jgi:hypothetical protein
MIQNCHIEESDYVATKYDMSGKIEQTLSKENPGNHWYFHIYLCACMDI